MESLDHNFQAHSADQSITTWQMRQDWHITARWARFLSIIYFVFAGIGIIGVLGLATVYKTMSSIGGLTDPLTEAILAKSGVLSVVITALIAVQVVVNLFQFRFANRMKEALQSTDQLLLEEAWFQFSQFFKWTGIMVIALIVLYFGFIILLITMLGTAFGRG